MHIALTLRMQSLRSEELTLLQTSRIRRPEIGGMTRKQLIAHNPRDGKTLERGEVSIGQVSSGEGVALVVGFGLVGVGGSEVGCVHCLEGEEDAGEFDGGVGAVGWEVWCGHG